MTQQFKAGDKVRVVKPYGSLVKGDVHTVDRVDEPFVYLAPYRPYAGWDPDRFELAEPEKPKFKKGDCVIVMEGATYSIGDRTYDTGFDGPGVILSEDPDVEGDWRIEFECGNCRWANEQFISLETEKVEIGDTVEVTSPAGTAIRGVVTELGSLGGLFFDGGNAYVSAEVARSVKIIKKVKKPKVWAVGDVMEGGDYASETIKDGTLLGTQNDSVIKSGDLWINCQTAAKYAPIQLSEPRTIAYVPEVSA